MLKELRDRLAKKVGGLKSLQEKGFAEDATVDDVKALDGALEEIKTLKADIAKAEEIDEIEKSQARPADEPVEKTGDTNEVRSVPAQATDKLSGFDKVALSVVGMIKSSAAQTGTGWNGTADQMDKMGYGSVAEEIGKSVNSLTDASGGFAIGEDFNEEIFQELRGYTAFLQGGPNRFPMPKGNMNQSGVDTRPEVGYRAEEGAINVSSPTLRDISLSAKSLGGIVPITNEIVRWTDGRAMQMVKETLSVEMGVHMDAAAFEGVGSATNPTGIYNVAGITTFAANGGNAPTIAQIDADTRQLINVIAMYPILQRGVAWVMPQRVLGFLQDLRDGNSNYVYPTLQSEKPTFKGYPVLKAGTVKTNGGAGTDETTIGLVSFSNILMGEGTGLQLGLSNEASYTSGGNTISAFQNNMTLVRAMMEHDWTPRYNEAVGTLTACQWGG